MSSVSFRMFVVCWMKTALMVGGVVLVEVIMVIVDEYLAVVVVVVAAPVSAPILVMAVEDKHLMLVVVDIVDQLVEMISEHTHLIASPEMVDALIQIQRTNVAANLLYRFPTHISGDCLCKSTILALRHRCCPNFCLP